MKERLSLFENKISCRATIRRMEISFEYKIRRSRRAWRLRISVYPGGEVVVTVPVRVSDAAAREFVYRERVWIEKKVLALKKFIPIRTGEGSTPRFAECKERAAAFAAARVSHFNSTLGYPFKKIAVRDHQSKWGSCSSTGTLSFNYRILFLPPALADYLIVHEICHLKEFNHTGAFWKLVEYVLPDWKERRGELKRFLPQG